MTELHLPWLELSVVLPLIGAAWVSRARNAETMRGRSMVFGGLTLLVAVGAWQDFRWVGTFEAHDHWDVLASLTDSFFVIDKLSAPLLPLSALLYLLTMLATLRTKVRRFSFSSTLVSESILLATLSCNRPWGVIALLAIGTLPPLLEIRSRGRPTRVYALHMALFVGLMVVGWTLVGRPGFHAAGVFMLIVAALLRSGIVPLHCWMTDLFENATFGTALLFVAPMVGAYAAVRLVLPVAPDWALRGISFVSLATAMYAAGMALVQQDSRRLFCYLFLSHSALVLVGLETATPVGLTGALCVWISVGLSLAGFGLTLRCLEARAGRLSLDRFHGLYEHMPALGVFFLLTGLSSIGFPGTLGFVGTELLIEGVVQAYPLVGLAMVLTAAINGIAVVHAYFRLFTGTRHEASISLQSRVPERIAVLVLSLLILGGGLFPQPGIASRYQAAMKLVATRQERLLTDSATENSLALSPEMNRGKPAPPFPKAVRDVCNE